MLVTRQCEPEQSHWPINKFDASRKHPSPPRMSNPYDAALSVQSEWQGQQQYTPTSGNSFPQHHAPAAHASSGTAGNALGIQVKEGEPSPHVHTLPPVSVPRTHPSPVSNPSDAMDGMKIAGLVHDRPQDVGRHSFGGNSLSPAPSNGQESQGSSSHNGHGDKLLKSDEEDDFDDDDMDGEGQTAAERTAARRKMKRFRLTHQQTRFLMSEFAKQPHPDAAHRERLSREIPGLSPRQVQVWFQNRRAKIKRLNADDRDRMIKMRAVPDDFDNVQALHSQYGAVHGLGTSMPPAPSDLGAHSYAQHMIRPLIVDVRRNPGDNSHSGLTPGFGGIGFGPAPNLNSPAMMSPISSAAGDRYPYGSQFPAPIGGAPRTSNPFGSQSGLDSPLDASRQSPHPLQPQLRDPMSRTRSESSQSPLRSGMSWKGDSIDYSNFRASNTSPGMDDRNPSMYQPASMGGYDSTSFSTGSPQPSSTMSYPTIPRPQSGPHFRSSTTSLPLNVDPRDQYRTAGSELHTSSPSSQPRSTPTSAPYSSSSYTTSYPPTSLTTPMDYTVPRSSDPKANMQDPQMSAQIAPPSHFTQAVNGGLGSQDHGRQDGHERKRSLTLPSGAPRPLF